MDPGSEEDPDIFVVLAEGVFYQASYDGTEVAVIADYPGLLPASHVSRREKISLEKSFFALPHPSHCLVLHWGGVWRVMLLQGRLQRERLRRRARLLKGRSVKSRPVPRQRGKDLKVYFNSHIQL